MRRLSLISLLLLSSAWIAAQTYPSSSPQSTNQSTSTGNETTVEGCLSSSNGNFTLAANDGKTYQLTGDTAKLNEHVGHEVQIKGTQSAASSSSPSSSSASSASSSQTGSATQPTLNVTSVKHISTTCTNTSSGTSH